jgi:hypothetical protein
VPALHTLCVKLACDTLRGIYDCLPHCPDVHREGLVLHAKDMNRDFEQMARVSGLKLVQVS